MSDAQATEYRFDRFRLRPAERQLLVDGTPAKLGARAFDLLLALIERRSRTVTRAELFALVWPGRVVEDQNLQVQVVALRKLLGPAAIATVPGRGYRFALPLLAEAEPAAQERVTPGAPAQVDPSLAPASPAAPPPAAAPLTNLPAELPPLYGRTQDLVAVLCLLQEHRLVTLAGPGGIGKTRLATAVAHQLRPQYPDGAWIVELAALADGELVASTAARVLGLPSDKAMATDDSVAQAVSAMAALIVLDNCEHVIGAAARFAAALRRLAPKVDLLATSQEPLRIDGERVYRLAALAVPETTDIGPIDRYGAVALLLARVRALDPRFALDDGNAAALVDVCRRLDGIPLALELAAARVPLLGLEGVRARLDERFRLLTAGSRDAPTRQQTLRAALEWSHGLLSGDEQAVFRRLGAFAGSFVLEAAQQVAADDAIDEWAVLDHLGALVDKSLVQVLDGASPRYRLLESARAFALERLAAADESSTFRRRHALWVRAYWERHDRRAADEPALEWLARHAPEIDNLRAALRWTTADEALADDAVALVVHAMRLWIRAGLAAEAYRWCELVRPSAERSADPALRHGFTLARAILSAFADLYSAGESLALLEGQVLPWLAGRGDRVGRYLALHLAYVLRLRVAPDADRRALLDEMASLEEPGWSEMLIQFRQMDCAYEDYLAGRTDAYLAFCRENLERCRRLDARWEAWNIARLLIVGEYQAGHPQQAIAIGRQALDEIRAAGWMRQSVVLLTIWSWMVAESGDTAAARAALAEALPILRGERTVWRVGLTLAWLAAREGDAALAARISGWDDAVIRAVGPGVRAPASERSRAALLEHLGACLGEETLARLRAEGDSLDEATVLLLAIGEHAAKG